MEQPGTWHTVTFFFKLPSVIYIKVWLKLYTLHKDQGTFMTPRHLPGRLTKQASQQKQAKYS